MRPEDPREKRLPIWAQTLIEDLRRAVTNAERSALEARLATDPQGSLVQVTTYGEELPIGLGDRSITFRPSLGAAWDEAIQCSPGRGHYQGVLEVRGVSADSLRVEPASMNVIRVWQGKR